MDQRLVAWARAVKRRHRADHPVLWLFTDRDRLADPTTIVGRLPPTLCGVVWRGGDGQTLERLARLCRTRRIALAVSSAACRSKPRGAVWHVPAAGPWPVHGREQFLTASAHDHVELRRAIARGAQLVFLSPVFPTRSHPGARSVGPRRFAALVRGVARPAVVLALGGVDGARARSLPRPVAGAAAIDAFLT